MDDSFKSLGLDAAAFALLGILKMFYMDRWNRLCQNAFTVDYNFQPMAC
ncbi:MAG: hypothetical protein M0R06_18515 [Sphaerochaeta sp.]|jgi:hypothetical protein|nr:hypothetical protein [Sphaerochaeta sp.]